MRKMSILDMINYRQRQVVLHSYIYYELNDNVISDKEYDKLARRLVGMKKQYPDLWKHSEYYKQFGDDYNGCTGFSLYHDLDDHQKEIIKYIAMYRHE